MPFDIPDQYSATADSVPAVAPVDKLWQEFDEPAIVESLPPLSPEHFSLEDREQMYTLARTAWENIYHPEDMIVKLRFGERTNTLRKEMKFIRKHGLVLDSAYIRFDEGHWSPPIHKRFTKVLGDFNDHYDTPEHQIYAEKVISHIEQQYPSTDFLDFTPASDESFAEYFYTERDQIAQFSQQERLLAKEYHTMRKLLRGFMNTTRMASAVKGDPLSRSYCSVLIALNDELGKVHDTLVRGDYYGTVDYKTTLVTLPPDIKERIDVFLQATKK